MNNHSCPHSCFSVSPNSPHCSQWDGSRVKTWHHLLQTFKGSLKPHRRCSMLWRLVMCPVALLMTHHQATCAPVTGKFFTLTDVSPFHVFAYAVSVPWNHTPTCPKLISAPLFSLSSNATWWFSAAVFLWNGSGTPPFALPCFSLYVLKRCDLLSQPSELWAAGSPGAPGLSSM